jgi:secondary thiamine-phosphate synthase enzyme
MPAHARSVLTQSSITIPVARGRLLLGTWQGIYLWEHRRAAQGRKLSVSVLGDA